MRPAVGHRGQKAIRFRPHSDKPTFQAESLAAPDLSERPRLGSNRGNNSLRERPRVVSLCASTRPECAILKPKSPMCAHHAVRSGILFAPNASGKSYISLYAHRGNGNRRRKNKWAPAFVPPMEHAVFCRADCSTWQDSNGHYWGIHGNGTAEIGDRGEWANNQIMRRNS